MFTRVNEKYSPNSLRIYYPIGLTISARNSICATNNHHKTGLPPQYTELSLGPDSWTHHLCTIFWPEPVIEHQFHWLWRNDKSPGIITVPQWHRRGHIRGYLQTRHGPPISIPHAKTCIRSTLPKSDDHTCKKQPHPQLRSTTLLSTYPQWIRIHPNAQPTDLPNGKYYYP